MDGQSTQSTRGITLVFVTALVGGSAIGVLSPTLGERLGEYVDPLVVLLVAAAFFTMRWEGMTVLRDSPRTMVVSLAINFVAIPLVAFALTRFVSDDAVRLGALIYCLAPCTDWFLGFTRIAGGNVVASAALIPVQMVLQLMLFPVWLGFFARETAAGVSAMTGESLFEWFILPAVLGLGLRLVLRISSPSQWRARAVAGVDRAIPVVIATVILTIFAANAGIIVEHATAFLWVLMVVFLFFVVTFLLSEVASKWFALNRPQQVSVGMTAAARNAPMMLALTTVVLPDQPMVHAAIILGMLIEFPHLTVLTHVYRRRWLRWSKETVGAHVLAT